jgi:hypothetical protein
MFFDVEKIAERVSADYMLHLFALERPGQHRGVAEMKSTLNTGAASRRWREATLASAETARLGSWAGTNPVAETNTIGSGDGATDISGARSTYTNGVKEAVMGWEVVWQYSGLTFAYGSYSSDRSNVTGDNGKATAQAFSIKYEVKF